MKIALIVVGILCVLGGLFGAALAYRETVWAVGESASLGVAVVYLVTGVVSSLVFFALAAIMHRLEYMEMMLEAPRS